MSRPHAPESTTFAASRPRQASIYRRALVSGFVFSVCLGGLGAWAGASVEAAWALALCVGLGIPAVGLAAVHLGPMRKLKRRLATMMWCLEQVGAGDFLFDLPPAREREAELFRTMLLSMRAEIARGRALIEARDRERRRLYSHVVHDMATPLTTLMMTTDGLADDASAERLGRIESELDALHELLERLRLLSVMEHPDFVPNIEPIGIAPFLAGLAAAYPPSVALSCTAEPLTVIACPKTLKTALQNLVDNAVAASQGRPVVVSAARDASGCHIRIADSGPGFALTGSGLDLPVTPPRLPNGIRGSGLGLIIARAAVQTLGATLTLENRPEGGGLVRFVLPMDTSSGGARSPE